MLGIRKIVFIRMHRVGLEWGQIVQLLWKAGSGILFEAGLYPYSWARGSDGYCGTE